MGTMYSDGKISQEFFEKELEGEIFRLKNEQLSSLENEWKNEKEDFVDMVKCAPKIIAGFFWNNPETILYSAGIVGGIVALREGVLRLDEYITPYLPNFAEAKLPPRLEEISGKLEPFANYFRYVFAMPIIPIVVKATPVGSYFTVRNERKRLQETDAEKEAKYVFSELKNYKDKIDSCKSKKCAVEILDEIKGQKRKIWQNPILKLDYHHPDKLYLIEMYTGFDLLLKSLDMEY